MNLDTGTRRMALDNLEKANKLISCALRTLDDADDINTLTGRDGHALELILVLKSKVHECMAELSWGE